MTPDESHLAEELINIELQRPAPAPDCPRKNKRRK